MARSTSSTAATGPTLSTPASQAATVKAGDPVSGVAPTSTDQGFVGLATSDSTIPGLAGPPDDLDTAFVNLLKSLSPGAPPLLRLGGNSGDESWWPVTGMKEPYLYTLSADWAARVKALLTALGGKAVLGVPLKLGPKSDPQIASAEVSAFNQYIGPNLIDAFELGNEPEYYPLSVVTGQHTPGPDTIPAYTTDFTQVASTLGGVSLAGPGSVGPVFINQLSQMLAEMPTSVKLATIHAYPLKNCSDLSNLSVSDFFTPASIQGLAASIHTAVKAAAADGKPLRVDEMNGVTCGGQPGISNSFAEALWVLNMLPALWQAGVQGVNIQSVYGGVNQVIHATRSDLKWTVTVQPEVYGLLAFASAVPGGSHLLSISNSGLSDFYQFAVRTPNGSEKVVLTNVGSASRKIGVRAAGTHGNASVSLLTAGSLGATSGVTLGGQTLDTHTGQLAGARKATTVKPNHKGVYQVQVPAHSAAIVTLAS